MSKFIITGVTGFVGSNLARKLLCDGHSIYVISRKNSKYDKIKDIKENLNIFEYDGDIKNLVDFYNDVKPDITIHLASLFLGEHLPKDIDNLIDSNLKFSTQILESMRASNCNYLINTSSYLQHYDDELYNPMNLYSATKQAFEDIIKFYSDAYNLKCITLELFDTYGPNDTRPKILNLLNKYSETKLPLDMSEGNQILDLTYIDDIIEAYLHTIELLLSKSNHIPEKYALISNNRIKLKDLVTLYEEITNKKVFINWGAKPYRPREIMCPWTQGDSLPGWYPKISIKEGLKKSFLNNSIQHFSIDKTSLDGLIVINPFISFDERGSFLKDYSESFFMKNDISHDLKEVFYASSTQGVIRGLHFQNTKEQAKLVRCLSGIIYDVVVDLRKNSSTFGQWEGFYLSEENNKQLFIPEGFAHGYLVLKDAVVSYKCNENFYSEYDDGILWNDSDLKIDWPLNLVKNITVSQKDKNLQSFKSFKNKFYQD